MGKATQRKGKGNRKKKADAFEKKEWFKLKLPKITGIKVAHYGWTPANKTAQGVLVEDRLRNRVVTIRCGDLEETPQPDKQEELKTSINLKLRIADTKDNECYLDFHGMELTRDRTCSLLKKWVTLIEAQAEIKTTDGFVFRVFALALTHKLDGQCKKTAYAKTSQVKRIRQKMIDIMNTELGDRSTRDFVGRLFADVCGTRFKDDVHFVYPVKHAVIRKVKLIKRPNKEDLRRIVDLHTAADEKAEEE